MAFRVDIPLTTLLSSLQGCVLKLSCAAEDSMPYPSIRLLLTYCFYMSIVLNLPLATA